MSTDSISELEVHISIIEHCAEKLRKHHLPMTARALEHAAAYLRAELEPRYTLTDKGRDMLKGSQG